ncbi:MAG: hypothetical protein RL154_750 [Pseudomonadota bacterium]
MFKKNVGGKDRKFRLFFGIALVILASIADFIGIIPRMLGFVTFIGGIILFATGLFGFCGLYIPFGKNTACPMKKEK